METRTGTRAGLARSRSISTTTFREPRRALQDALQVEQALAAVGLARVDVEHRGRRATSDSAKAP